MTFPPHIAMTIEHNTHATYYEPVEKWITNHEEPGHCYLQWVSPEERQKAINTNSVWVLHWYPETPVGFHVLAASTFDALINGCANNAFA